MGNYQKITHWVVGILLTLGFLSDAYDFLVVEQPSNIHWLTESMWVGVFVIILLTIEMILWVIFYFYNEKFKK